MTEEQFRWRLFKIAASLASSAEHEFRKGEADPKDAARHLIIGSILLELSNALSEGAKP